MAIYDFRNSSNPPAILNRLRRLDSRQPRLRAGSYTQTESDWSPVLQSTIGADSTLQLSSSDVSKVGSSSPTYNNMGFGIQAGSTGITIHWDGTHGSSVIVMQRSDGSKFPIPQGSISVTGLSPSTTYYARPFWSPYNKGAVGWSQGTAGTPQILFTTFPVLENALQQNQQQREPLTLTYMTFTTPSSGSVDITPTSPYGNLLRCVMKGTTIETVDGSEYMEADWPCEDWWRIICADGQYLHCTPDHPLYTPDGHRKDAELFLPKEYICHKDGDLEVVFSGPFKKDGVKVMVTMPRLHLFWANGFLSHNIKMDPLNDWNGGGVGPGAIPGPYTDDTDAAAHGVAIDAPYYIGPGGGFGGFVVIRIV